MTLSSGLSLTLTIVLDARNGFQALATSCGQYCGADVISGSGLPTNETSCSAARLSGTFGLMMTKWTSAANADAQNTLGLLTFNEDGTLIASWTENNAGTITTFAANGAYGFNSDGSGEFGVVQGLNSINFDFVVDSKNRGLRLIWVGCVGWDFCFPDAVLTGNATKQ